MKTCLLSTRQKEITSRAGWHIIITVLATGLSLSLSLLLLSFFSFYLFDFFV